MRDLVAVARRVGLIEHRANDVGAAGLFQRAEHEADADFAGGDALPCDWMLLTSAAVTLAIFVEFTMPSASGIPLAVWLDVS